jgi:hypothetical protein
MHESNPQQAFLLRADSIQNANARRDCYDSENFRKTIDDIEALAAERTCVFYASF